MLLNCPFLYITALHYPSRKATNIQVIANAREFQKLLGPLFTLSISQDEQGELKDINVEANGLHRFIPWHLASIMAFFWLPWWAQKKAPKGAVLYFKDPNLAAIAIFWNRWFFNNRYRIAIEVHHYNREYMERYVIKYAHFTFCITSYLKNLLEKSFPSDSRVTVMEPDGADPGIFQITQDKNALRKELNLPINPILIGYTGSFQTKGFSKGIETALKTMIHLDKKYTLIIVGGEPKEIDEKKQHANKLGLADRIIFVNRVPHGLIPGYLASFDFLIAPYPNNQFNAFYTSPLKLFEYMAAHRPIIIADLPSIRDILDENTAYLCASDDSRAYARAIQQAQADPQAANQKSEKAFRLLKEKYTWQARASRIVATLSGHMTK